MRTSMIVLIVVGWGLLSSCEDNTEEFNPIELNGTYQGTFTVDYLASGDSYSNPVTLTFTGNSYSSTEGADRFPAGGSGLFETGANSVTFTDENFWTADFDWNLILSDEYSVTETDTRIILSATKNNIGTYTYELIK